MRYDDDDNDWKKERFFLYTHTFFNISIRLYTAIRDCENTVEKQQKR